VPLLLRRVSRPLARRGRVLPRLLVSILLQISKPLVKRGLLLLEASRMPLLLLRVNKPLARRVLLWLKSHLRLLLHRVKPLLQLGHRGRILLLVLRKGLLLQLMRQVWPRLP
jgi:hypothetical protein